MKCEIICIIDRSGSMNVIVDDAIGGFNTFLNEQKLVEGEASLTFVQFDTEYEVIHENRPLNDVPELTTETYKPRGGTALLDAVGKTIDDVGKRLSNTEEKNRPDKVIVAILTDGAENSSNKYTLEGVKSRIKHQKEKYQWEFIFLAANQDAFAAGANLGIAAVDTFAFAATGTGIRKGYANMSRGTTAYRSN